MAGGHTASWDPPTLARENTLEFLTVGPDEGEHWSPVWVVAVDDKLYVRLGSRAAARFQRSTTAPFVKVRIAGREFDNVRGEPAPEMAERVAAAMAVKYRSDLVVRFMNDPLTARLVAQPIATPHECTSALSRSCDALPRRP